MPPKTNKNWTTRSTAHKLWNDVNEYVDSYTSTHQDQLETDWFWKWYGLFHVAHIGQSNISFQVAAFAIANNPNATVHECLKELGKFIPSLKNHLRIHQVNDTNGNLRYTINEYGFLTPKKS